MINLVIIQDILLSFFLELHTGQERCIRLLKILNSFFNFKELADSLPGFKKVGKVLQVQFSLHQNPLLSRINSG